MPSAKKVIPCQFFSTKQIIILQWSSKSIFEDDVDHPSGENVSGHDVLTTLQPRQFSTSTMTSSTSNHLFHNDSLNQTQPDENVTENIHWGQEALVDVK